MLGRSGDGSERESLGRLTGTDNLVEFATRWYNPNPLVIQGRGAGVDATAAGVLSDMIELAYSLTEAAVGADCAAIG